MIIPTHCSLLLLLEAATTELTPIATFRPVSSRSFISVSLTIMSTWLDSLRKKRQQIPSIKPQPIVCKACYDLLAVTKLVKQADIPYHYMKQNKDIDSMKNPWQISSNSKFNCFTSWICKWQSSLMIQQWLACKFTSHRAIRMMWVSFWRWDWCGYADSRNMKITQGDGKLQWNWVHIWKFGVA